MDGVAESFFRNAVMGNDKPFGVTSAVALLSGSTMSSWIGFLPEVEDEVLLSENNDWPYICCLGNR